MAKSLYCDLDNNKFLSGSLTTEIASTPVFYSGNTETVTVDLIQRDSSNNLRNISVPSTTTVSLLVGTGSSVISVPALLPVVQTGVTATATCSLYPTIKATGTAALHTGVTAVATASLYGNIRAMASAVITRGTVCTLSLTVVSAITPVINKYQSTSGNNLDYISTIEKDYYGISNTNGYGGVNGRVYFEITDPGYGFYGAQVYGKVSDGVNPDYDTNITNLFTFQNGQLVAVNPSAVQYADIRFVLDPSVTYAADVVTVVCGGSGFPDGVNIPFTIPSDEDGDGRPCTGFMRALNGSIVSVTSIVSRGTRFTSSVTNGKNYQIAPLYSIASVTVSCAGAGYWGQAPEIIIDDTVFANGTAGAVRAQITVGTKSDGSVGLILVNNGYGYVATPGLSIGKPRFSDGVRVVTVSNSPSGYADGKYACTVSAPTVGSAAVVSYVVTAGVGAFMVEDPGFGYLDVPTISVPGPNLTQSVKSITVTCAGLGYTDTPGITFIGTGSGAVAQAVVSGGKIASVTIVTGGSGYTGTVTVSFDAPVNQGRIASISILTAGTNYNSVPTVTFNGGGGTGAAATVGISNGAVSSIELLEAGSGYSSAPAVVIAPGDVRTVYANALSVTTAFVNGILPNTAVTVQINLVTTTGISTILQAQAAVAGTL